VAVVDKVAQKHETDSYVHTEGETVYKKYKSTEYTK
jgi:hypothetical protein